MKFNAMLCRNLLFQTVDLYECKQMYKVVECLRALAATVCLHVLYIHTVQGVPDGGLVRVQADVQGG